jgi:hypothetical protein
MEVILSARGEGAWSHRRHAPVTSGGPARGVFWADLIPTVAHVPLPWIMGYDLYPLTTLASKKAWLPRAAAGGWLGFFEHDADTPWARVVEEKPGKFRAEPLG